MALLPCIGTAQVAGIGVVSPVVVSNSALIADFHRRWAWVGYEPSRFGLPELHWAYAGIASPLVPHWHGALEVWGRVVQPRFSHVRLRLQGAVRLTAVLGVGIAVTVTRYSVEGMPTRWWGGIDIGMRTNLSPKLKLGSVLENVVLWSHLKGSSAEQRFSLGVGWSGGTWGAELDAVIATLSSPALSLTTTAELTRATTIVLRTANSPLQLQLGTHLELSDVALDLGIAFHSVLGWRHALTVAYRWD
ncbi:MAG: hypothetical protein NZ960_02920 [Candidatus Kapabacteria bacterium]|nr:hypothetical protein [Candidatus Kapabacteria bacterium]